MIFKIKSSSNTVKNSIFFLNNFELVRSGFSFILIYVLSLSAFNLYAKDEREVMETSLSSSVKTYKLNSLEEVNQSLDVQNQQLVKMLNNAKDVLYFEAGLPKAKPSKYCNEIWQALKTQDSFDIPQPVMLASNESEKEILFNYLRAYAQNNFNRFLSQKGNLNPKTYRDRHGQVWWYGPYYKTSKDKLNILNDLPVKFDKSWSSNPFSVLGTRGIFNENLTTHLLYLPLYPVKGYQAPVVFSLIKDQCTGCTGLSIGHRNVSVAGLLEPEFGNGEFFSHGAYEEALIKAEAKNSNKLIPPPPFLLMGLATLDHKLTFWQLSERVLEKPKQKPVTGYYNAGDDAKYFRHYMLDLFVAMQASKFSGTGSNCSVSFN